MEQGSCHRHILSMSVDRTRKSSFVNQLVVQQNGVWVRDEDMEWYDSATSGNQNQAGAYRDCGTAHRARFGLSFPSRLIEARDTISHVVHGRPGQEVQQRYQF